MSAEGPAGPACAFNCGWTANLEAIRWKGKERMREEGSGDSVPRRLSNTTTNESSLLKPVTGCFARQEQAASPDKRESERARELRHAEAMTVALKDLAIESFDSNPERESRGASQYTRLAKLCMPGTWASS